MAETRGQRQAGDGVAVRRRATIGIERFERAQARAGFLHGGFGRGIEPAQHARVGDAPQGAVERQRRQIGFQNLGRIEARQASGRRLLPQAIRDAGLLARGAAGTLRDGGLAGAFGHQPRHPRRAIITRAAREAGIDHDRNAVERQAGLGDRCRQHDLAPLLRVGRDRGALCGGIEAAVEAVEQNIGAEPLQPLGGALDLGDAGQEGEDPAGLLAQCQPDRGGD